MKVVAFSDTHGQHRAIEDMPEGDMLLFTGDLSVHGNLSELRDFASWFSNFNHDYKIMVAGNHDFMFNGNKREKALQILRDKGITYLEEETIVLDGITLYGSPYSETFDRYAFNEGFGKIPPKTDVLVTHGPPHGRNDYWNEEHGHIGCRELRERVDKVQPLYHIYGHCHERYGETNCEYGESVNVSVTDKDYEVRARPFVFEVEKS